MKDVPVRRHLRRQPIKSKYRDGWLTESEQRKQDFEGQFHRFVNEKDKTTQEIRESRYSPEELKRLSRVDYVELPMGTWVEHGFACETCRFFNGAACTNNAIDAPVLPNGCCNAWSGPKREQFRARRAFEQ